MMLFYWFPELRGNRFAKIYRNNGAQRERTLSAIAPSLRFNTTFLLFQ